MPLSHSYKMEPLLYVISKGETGTYSQSGQDTIKWIDKLPPIGVDIPIVPPSELQEVADELLDHNKNVGRILYLLKYTQKQAEIYDTNDVVNAVLALKFNHLSAVLSVL